MKLVIKGIPQPKQSARFSVKKIGNKVIAKSYQNAEVKQNERNIAYDVKSQLPKGFIPFNVAIGVKVLFVFPPLSSFSKKKISEIESGKIFYKETKPDLTDNLMKGTCDAMNGIVYVDDARICRVETEKIYGMVPRTEIEFYVL